MGTRFLAILAVTALGAGSAMVGLTMASGSWNTLGTGLMPGEAYALKVGNQVDRFKLELANSTAGSVAWFSVYSPSGTRAGFYTLDSGTHTAEVVASSGVWLLFVYKAQGGDLTISAHGTGDFGEFLPAEVQRRDIKLGVVPTQQAIDQTYTAVLDREPALAGVYLQGSARNFQSELRSTKGPVEVVSESETNAVAAGVIVDAHGDRTTNPAHLVAGPYTAHVRSDSLSGTLVLVALYLQAPDFAEELAPEAPMPEKAPRPEQGPSKPPQAHPKPPKHPHAHEKKVVARDHGEWTDCGTVEARVPTAVMMDRPAQLRLTTEEGRAPVVSIFDPGDELVEAVKMKEKGEGATVNAFLPGEYVLYARGAAIQVALHGPGPCALRELTTQTEVVASMTGEGLKGGDTTHANFTLELPPLEFALRMASPDAIAVDLNALFTGEQGKAAEYHESLGVGLFGGGMPLPFFGEGHGYRDSGQATSDATKMVKGDWALDVSAQAWTGQLDALALHYVRDAGEQDEDDDN